MCSADQLPRGQGVLITRPTPGAHETASRVAAMGLFPILAPLLEIHPAAPVLPPPDQIAAVMLTSGNAIAALPPMWHAAPVLTVGDATARRAREAGFGDVVSADGDAAALADLVRSRLHPMEGTLLLASGRGQGLALAADLRRSGYRVARRVVYAAVPVASLPPVAHIALTDATTRAVLFFSAATARLFIRLVRAAGLEARLRHLDAITIGAQVSVALRGERWSRVRVAGKPNQDEMLALLR